jgi:hypothetical protein
LKQALLLCIRLKLLCIQLKLLCIQLKLLCIQLKLLCIQLKLLCIQLKLLCIQLKLLLILTASPPIAPPTPHSDTEPAGPAHHPITAKASRSPRLRPLARARQTTGPHGPRRRPEAGAGRRLGAWPRAGTRGILSPLCSFSTRFVVPERGWRPWPDWRHRARAGSPWRRR